MRVTLSRLTLIRLSLPSEGDVVIVNIKLLDLKPGISYLESIYSSPAHEVKHSLNAKLISTEGIPQPGIEWTYSF